MRLALALIAALAIAAPAIAQQGGVIRSVSGDRCSGTIAAANTSQVASSGDNSRLWLTVQNPPSATEPLYVDFGPNHPASSTLSTELAPGGSINFLAGVVPMGQVNVSAATVGHRFVCYAGR